MKRWLRAALPLGLGLFILSGCGTANVEQVKSVTIYNKGEAIRVSADDPAFDEITNTAEHALEAISDVYKGVDELSSFEQAEQSVIIELTEPQPLTVSTWDDDGDFRIRYIAIPLSGDDFDKNNLIAAGATEGTALSTFKTRKTHLKYLRKLINKQIEAK